MEPPGSSPSLASFALLPLEIISEFLSYLLARPRILYASIVCRRWRKAALMTPISLPALQRDSCYRFVDLLTRVTHMSVIPLQGVKLPLSLTSLSWDGTNYSSPGLLAPYLQVTYLSVLSFNIGSNIETQQLQAELLMLNANSLASLELRSASSSPIHASLAVHLPRLRHFYVSLGIKDDAITRDTIASLLKKHCTQLISLTVRYLGHAVQQSVLCSLQYPSLRSADIGGSASVDQLERFVEHSPFLQQLTLRLQVPPLKAGPLLSHALTGVSLPAHIQLANLAPMLRLTLIDAPTIRLSFFAALPLASSLRSLTCALDVRMPGRSTDPNALAFAKFSALEELSIVVPISALPLTIPPLLFLRSLTLRPLKPLSSSVDVQTVIDFMRQFYSFRFRRLALYNVQYRFDEPQWETFILEAEKAGVEQMLINTPEMLVPLSLRKKLRWLRLSSVDRYEPFVY